MSINYQFGDVDAHGATIRAQAASLEAEHQAIVRDVLASFRFSISLLTQNVWALLCGSK